jgi:hypothetical protein
VISVMCGIAFSLNGGAGGRGGVDQLDGVAWPAALGRRALERVAGLPHVDAGSAFGDAELGGDGFGGAVAFRELVDSRSARPRRVLGVIWTGRFSFGGGGAVAGAAARPSSRSKASKSAPAGRR